MFKNERKRVISKATPCILNKRRKLIVPNVPLSNEELKQYASCLEIPFFRGVFMRNELPNSMWDFETGIVNLDNSNGTGTHWVCYKKWLDTVYYFDSFGNLPPPIELVKYFGNIKHIVFNYDRRQSENTSVCGHLCLEFLATSVSLL